jgi:hypothetical protein
VPLLLPPGFCVCAAGAPCHDAATESDDHDHDGSPHQHPQDQHHSPGCPAASADADRSRGAEPTSDISSVGASLAAVTCPLFPPRAVRTPVRATSPAWPSAPPLYLAHCSFVI